MRSQFLLMSAAVIAGLSAANAAPAAPAELPIKKVSLFSSGVGYFERGGEVKNSVKLTLPFQTSEMDDALKSLTVYDSATNAPYVSYPSFTPPSKQFEAFKIDLSNNPNMEQIFNSLRGAQIEIYAPEKITGKIVGSHRIVEKNSKNEDVQSAFLSLLIEGKIQLINTKDIRSYAFVDKEISRDLERSLELILTSRSDKIKNLELYLPSDKKRDVSLSYVIAAPVWKATYRLNLAKKSFLQGWAIVDNAGETDWKNVELSLVVGRPVSFTQPLYKPYYLNRASMPLMIAGSSEAQIYDVGFGDMKNDIAIKDEPIVYEPQMKARSMASAGGAAMEMASPRPAPNYQTSSANAAGEQFVFTFKQPITLNKQQSAMLPFVQGEIEARKVSIFSAQNAPYQTAINPRLGVQLKNISGMKLPAAAISVYEDGEYAGDSLIDFLPRNEKRLISYGDDLALNGVISRSTSSYVDKVKISKGVMTISTNHVYLMEYLFKNSADKAKNIIVEHPFINEAKLIEPSKYSEKTGSLYRFDISVGGEKSVKFTVKEEKPIANSVVLANMDFAAIIYYAQGEFPQNVKNAFKKAAELSSKATDARRELSRSEQSFSEKKSEQERVRQNIYAVEKSSVQGEQYLKQLTKLDSDIAALLEVIETQRTQLDKANKAYENYIAGLEI